MSDFTSLRGLLEFHVKQLRLKQDAAWPRESENMKEMIKAYQRSQQKVELHDARFDTDDGSGDADSDDFSVSVGA